MVPIGGAVNAIASIIGIAIGAVCSVWLLGLPVALVSAKLTLPTGKHITVFRPLLVFGVGALATVVCFFAGGIAAQLYIESVGYPPFRIEPAAFRGGPSGQLIWRGVQVGWLTQLCIAVAIWFFTLRASAKPAPVATEAITGAPRNNAGNPDLPATDENKIQRSDATDAYFGELGDDPDVTDRAT